MRKILIELTVDWEDYEDVSPDLIIEDAIRDVTDGVSIEIIEDVTNRNYKIVGK